MSLRKNLLVAILAGDLKLIDGESLCALIKANADKNELVDNEHIPLDDTVARLSDLIGRELDRGGSVIALTEAMWEAISSELPVEPETTSTLAIESGVETRPKSQSSPTDPDPDATIERARVVKRDFEYPMIASLGTSYTGIDHVIIAVDVRYFDYGNATGFDQGGYAPDGSLAGLGWSSILSLATGVQLELTPCLYARFGYSFSQNPIADSESSFNVPSPVINQHFASVGLSWYATDMLAFTLTYGHGFENSVEGPIQTPLGPLPNSSVRNELTINGVALGITFRH